MIKQDRTFKLRKFTLSLVIPGFLSCSSGAGIPLVSLEKSENVPRPGNEQWVPQATPVELLVPLGPSG